MNNDLISRSELKKAIEEFEDKRGYSSLIEEQFFYNLDCIIDNAPTVSERPHGEWKIIEHETLYLMGIYQCNLCSYKYTCPDEFARNYCPNCGAKMSNSV